MYGRSFSGSTGSSTTDLGDDVVFFPVTCLLVRDPFTSSEGGPSSPAGRTYETLIRMGRGLRSAFEGSCGSRHADFVLVFDFVFVYSWYLTLT